MLPRDDEGNEALSCMKFLEFIPRVTIHARARRRAGGRPPIFISKARARHVLVHEKLRVL